MHLLPEKVNSITNLDPGNFVIRNPNALQTFILTVYIDIDYCHFYLFLLYKLRFDSLILNEDDDDDDDDDDDVSVNNMIHIRI